MSRLPSANRSTSIERRTRKGSPAASRPAVHRVDGAALLDEFIGRHAVRDREGLRMIGHRHVRSSRISRPRPSLPAAGRRHSRWCASEDRRTGSTPGRDRRRASDGPRVRQESTPRLVGLRVGGGSWSHAWIRLAIQGPAALRSVRAGPTQRSRAPPPTRTERPSRLAPALCAGGPSPRGRPSTTARRARRSSACGE